jgi:hypothetical protein
VSGHDLATLDDGPVYEAVCECGWRSGGGAVRSVSERAWRVHARFARLDDAHARAGERAEMAARRAERLRGLRTHVQASRAEVRTSQARVRARVRPAATDSRPPRGSAPLLEGARVLAGLSVPDLWCRYVALGGSGTVAELSAWLTGARLIDSRDHDIIAVALNEHFAAHGFGQPIDYRR